MAYVGRDEETDSAYYVSAALSPFDDAVEFTFSVIRRVNDAENQYLSEIATKGPIPDPADRTAILMVILEITEALLDWKKPARVDRCTADANLEDKALHKHQLVSQIFKDCGYKVTDCGDWNGQLLWAAERVEGGS